MVNELSSTFFKFYTRVVAKMSAETLEEANTQMEAKYNDVIRKNSAEFENYLRKKARNAKAPMSCVLRLFKEDEDAKSKEPPKEDEVMKSQEETESEDTFDPQDTLEVYSPPVYVATPWDRLSLWLESRHTNDAELPDNFNRIQTFPSKFKGITSKQKFHILKTDYPEFLRFFRECVESGDHPPLMEYRSKDRVYPVVADFDFRQQSNTRLFDNNFVTGVMSKMSSVIRKFVETDSPPQGVMLLKPVRPDAKVGTYRDGFHIHFPDVVVNRGVAEMIYNEFKNTIDPREYTPEGVTNDDVYDRASYSNSWFLYGAKKGDDEPEPWRAINHSYDMVQRLSLADHEESKYTAEAEKTITVMVKTMREFTDAPDQPIGLEAFKELLYLIRTRADVYELWFETLCAIKNVSETNGFDADELAHYFSKFSSKYDPRSVDDKLSKLGGYTGKPLTLGSIRYWAYGVNPTLEKEIISRYWNGVGLGKQEAIKEDLYDQLTSVSTPEIKMDIIKFDLEKMSEFAKISVKDVPWQPEYDTVFPLVGEDLLQVPEFKDDMFGICLQKYFTGDDGKCRIQTTDDCDYEFNGVILRKVNDSVYKTVVSTVFIPMLKSRHGQLVSSNAPKDVLKSYTTAVQYLGTQSKVKSGIESFRTRKGVYSQHLNDMLNGNIKNDKALELYAFKDCVYDIRTGEKRAGKVDDYITKWNPYEIAETDDEQMQKEIYDFIRTPLASDEEADSILDFYAMSFLGGQGHSIQKKFSCAFLYGSEGHNGKSVAGEMLLNSHGNDDDNYGLCLSNKMTVLSNDKEDPDAHSGSLLNFMGKRFVYGEEPGEGRKYSTSLIKTIFSGTGFTMSARAAYAKDATKFRPQFRLMVSQNSAPEFDCPDSATMNRITIYGYNKVFSANPGPGELPEDDNLIKRMKTKEYTQQLVMMGLKRCREILISGERMPIIPDSVKLNTKDVFDDQDPVKNLLKEHVEFTNNLTDHLKITSLLPLFSEHVSSTALKKSLIRILGPVKPNDPRDTRLLGKLVLYANAPHIKGAKMIGDAVYQDNLM